MNEIINDKHLIYSVYESVCSNCKYFNVETFKCKAFPKDIPNILLKGEAKHDKPFAGQSNNIIFKAK